MPIDGSSAIAFPSPSPTHGTSATLLPADPRLFRLMSTNGRYEIIEVPGFFCRLQLCSEHTFFLDAYDHAFVWAGARSRDVDVRLAHRFAALYLRAAEDGRPSSTAEEINEEAEPPGFLTHFQVWEDPTRSFDAYAAHLVAAKRDAMFGKLRPSASIYVDAQAGRYSQEWVRDVEALENGDRGVLERYANDHHQEELEWTGVCVLVTSLHANRLKAARCARLLARLDNAKVRYSAYDLAAPQHQHARMLAALALRAKGRSALLLLQLPLLFKDGDLLLVGTDAAQGGVLGNELKDEDVQAGSTSEALLARLRKQPANWSRLQHWEDERRLAGLLGQALDPDSAASKPSRTMRQKLQKKISRNPHLPTLEEVRAEGVFTSESTRQEREGFLDKQGGMFKGSWERRFFVLTVQGVLYWFKDANENGHALGCVELQGEHSVTVKPLGVNLTFEIRTEEKDWRMRADSGKQLSCWLAAISSLNAAKSGRGKGADGSVAFPVQGGREHGARATRRLLPKGRATTHLDTLVAPLILDAPSVKSRVSATAGGAAAAAALSWPRQREGAGSAAADRNPSMLARAANEETPFPMTRRVQPKPVSFPFGLVRKLSRRGIIDHVFLCISESLLLYYDCSRKSQAAWTQLAGLASAGGWDAVRGTWVVGSKRELWVGGGAHDELVDMRHPRGVIPLNECRAEAATVDGADAITLAAYDGSASERQLRVLCGSPAERDAWLAAIREAREVSLHRLYTLQQSRFAAEEARDTFRRERDASRREAERLHEEIAVYKAARERAQNAGASSDAGLRVVLGGLRGADDELEEASTRIRELGRALERAASERRRAEEGSGRRAAELAQEQARVEELQRELEATRQQHTASVLELTDKLQVAEARAEAAEARVAALHAASSEQTAQMRGELEAAHKRLLRAEAAEAESRAACASGITALPTVALSAVRAGAPTAIALTLDAPIAGDGTSEATEADSDGTEHRDDAEGQEETPATAHSPPAASPSAAEVEAMRRRFGEDARSVRSFMHFNGRLSGGTLATGIALDRLPASVQVERRDPFLLGGAPSGGPRPEDADPAAARYEAALGAWSAPFWMASISTRVVRRSFGLLRETALDEPYAVDFAYREAALARDEGVARNLATPMAPPEQRQRLIDRGRLPGPGEGPSAEARASSWFRSYFLGESTDGRRLLTSISGGDPGYEETSKIVGEAALLLALEHDALPASGACGGVLTPAVALGGALLDRLDGCGLRFAVRGTDLADDLPRMVADDFVRPIA